MTTFTSRKAIRDDIKGLYDATNAFNSVYSGAPVWSDIAGESPILTILSDGTSTQFQSLNKNPREHFYLVTTWVLYSIIDDSWTYDEAEDALDALEVTVSQVIRDNAAGSGVADLLEFTPTPSEIRRVPVNRNYIYITESRTIRAYLASGAL